MSNLDLYNELKKYLIPYSSEKNFSLPQRIIKSLKEVAPDSMLLYNERPLVLYFKSTIKLTTEEIFKKYWNFSESPIIFIETETDIEVYNGFNYVLEHKKPTPEKLNTNNLNYLSLISGEYLRSDAFTKSDRRLDKVLLQNIKDTREILINQLKFESPKIQDNNIQSIVNSLLGRIIFIRYLIDRKIALYYNKTKQVITNDDLKSILSNKEITYQFFRDLQSYERGFNGDWFPIDDNEESIIHDTHLSIISELISGTEIKSGQKSLFDFYDFSIIPIEFISNVYEHFIGEEKQKEDGAYYTPTFLVDYVLKYTIDDYFKNNPNEYNCKVLDPACGSGIFLVEAFRKLVAQYEKVAEKSADEKTLKQLVKDNIFGIDYNKDALQISVFSLYLAMLDYQDPKDIENFKFPYLLASKKNEDSPNFFENDFFDTREGYNKILKEKKLDFIIGNPPYGRGTIKQGSLADTYIKANELTVGNNDIVQPFMVRIKDFSDTKTKVGFIVTSKVLYNLQTKEFRTKHFLNQFKINHVLELSSVRKQIFENANVPVSILFYKYSTKEAVQQNTINYISMKPSPYFEKLKILLLSKSDFKKVAQSKLLEYDYLWKILVYGSYLDFNFIKRLKSLNRLDDYIESKAQGITIGNKQNSAKKYIGMPYIQTKQFKPFYIETNDLTWKETFAERTRSLEIFKAPSLLISKGISVTLDLKVGILQKDSIFSGSITAIKCTNKDTLYGIMGILYSSFFKYFIMNTASSIGVEREQIHNPEKFNLPYIHDVEIIKSSKNIEDFSKKNFMQNDKQFESLKEQLNQTVQKAFNLTAQEEILVDYTNRIVIPWVMQKNYDVAFEMMTYRSPKINDYVNIFIKHYSNIYEQNNMYFQVTVHWSKYAIGIYFKILNDKPNEVILWEKEENIENFLLLMQGKTLENLFIQKDIKGFESDGFYVVKPNEIKNWHKAIGYLDFYEFEDAILRAGK